jgi:hypothetical protein
MKLELSDDEVKFIMDVLGEMPSKTGAFLVMNNIAKQQQEAAQFEQVKAQATTQQVQKQQGDENV